MKLNNILTVASLIMANTSYSQHRDRCEHDSLNANQAFGRIDWTKRCASDDVVALYKRSDLPDMPREKIIEAVTNDWIYFYGKKRVRPIYPIFTADAKNGRLWVAPVADDSTCRVTKPRDVSIYTACVASCYHPDEPLLFSSGFVPINIAKEDNLDGLMVLEEESSLTKIKLKPIAVDSYIASRTETNHKLLRLSMRSGGELLVTPNHPLIVGSGHIVEAESLKVGVFLLKQDGVEDEIVSIDTEDYFGKVYNVQPDTASLKGNIVVADGYLSGSNWYQNGGYSHIGERILREEIPKSLLFR